MVYGAVVKIVFAVVERVRGHAVQRAQYVGHRVRNGVVGVVVVHITVGGIVADDRLVFGYIRFFARVVIQPHHRGVVQRVEIGVKGAQKRVLLFGRGFCVGHGGQILAVAVGVGVRQSRLGKVAHKRKPFEAFGQHRYHVVIFGRAEVGRGFAHAPVNKVV